MRLPLAVAFVTVATLTACAQNDKNFTPKTDEEKQLYTLGVLVSRDVQTFDFTDKELAIVKAGVDAGARGASKLEEKDMRELVSKLQELQGKRVEAAAAKAKTDGEAYLTKAAAEKGATKLASGVIYKSIKEGTGAAAKATDIVKVHYDGKLVSGKTFDKSDKEKPAEFDLNQMIPCWKEGLPQMKVGGKGQVICPSDTAYGPQGAPGRIPGNSVLVFEVELLEILAAPPAAEGAPAAAAPAGHPAH